MSTKTPRIIIATIALTLVSFAGFAAPADAKPAQQRTVWCC